MAARQNYLPPLGLKFKLLWQALEKGEVTAMAQRCEAGSDS
jgi:hypothetical protein